MNIGRYEILREIGRGGMGVVYEAGDALLGRSIALKVVREEFAADHELCKRILAEARAVARLSHASIVTIYDVGLDNDKPYLAMEFIDGQALSTVMRSPEFNAQAALHHILPQIAAALDYAHRNGIVHGDVKPGNVMVDRAGSAHLLDFGLADALQGEKTVGRTIGATIAYASPEQLAGLPLDGRSDQFALACIAYETISSKSPFADADQMSGMMRRLRGDFTPLPDPESKLGAAYQIFKQAFTRQPDARFPSCVEFIDSLNAAIDHPTLAPAIPSPPPPPDSFSAPVPQAQGEFTRMFLAQGPPPPFPAAPPPAPPPSTQYNTQYSTNVESAGEFTAMLGSLRSSNPPTRFLADAVAPSMVGGKVEFTKVEGTLEFFRNRLSRQYDSLERQASLTFWLWVLCFVFAFVIVASGIVLFFMGRVTEGAASLSASVLIYFIQRIFQVREDQFRREADQKNEHLEYGSKWLIVMQTIEGIGNSTARQRAQARLAQALTDKVHESMLKNSRLAQPAQPGPAIKVPRPRARAKSVTSGSSRPLEPGTSTDSERR